MSNSKLCITILLHTDKSQWSCGGSHQEYQKDSKKDGSWTRQWHEKFPFALLGYRTIVRTSFGETPYLLVYQTQVVIPTEVKNSSLQIIFEVEIEDI